MTRTEFTPPSLPGHSLSHTYYTPIPDAIASQPQEPVRLGVDEAGRGPVLGPMVYGVSYCLASYEPQLKAEYGFADSKTLSEEKRSSLLEMMCLHEHDLRQNVGWAIRSLSALDISAGMLRYIEGSLSNYNLNEQAHDATMDLIQGVLDLGVNVAEVYVDTVGPPMSYQAKLQKRFPQLKITVAKKADALYPVVSAASICAKVTRDFSLLWTKKELYGDCHDDVQWGSGYPSDPKTKKWLVEDVDKLFGWGSVVRFSWGTAKEALIGQNCYKLEWEEDNTKFDYDVTKMGKADAELNMEWYSKSCVYF
ncbi:ribonuclease H2 catalytic subunit RNH201 [Cyberlindnera jadinii NRRL Y-1542]|uniref:Ribonuclease n=1 Tax=Cyberlindnera jadinii (strain ATCC 18201 / CBS 1600 / BCRC 20928 / JCM 3617 / NBRC 0987 / NRRL Y-1542) TaxID=983966 RepID=A0A1E4S1J3_CYBJN|nr:ribonuclease H2 catalytic subunit [Cyberlindnera jadinii NRRL Y-1542]ODV73374.1 ribonuclease H2 catalytic subunit [Cyberlindnera jadinii NRRL Y-1542]